MLSIAAAIFWALYSVMMTRYAHRFFEFFPYAPNNDLFL